MPLVTLEPINTWVEVVASTTTDTVIQNRLRKSIYLTTEDPAPADEREGLILEPFEKVVIAAGNKVSCNSPLAVGDVFYLTIGEPAP